MIVSIVLTYKSSFVKLNKAGECVSFHLITTVIVTSLTNNNLSNWTNYNNQNFTL